MTMRRSLLSFTLGAALAASANLADAQAQDKGVTVGTLECHEASGNTLVFMSTHDLNCTFSGLNKNEPIARYAGKINRYGLDIGFTQNAVILWGVVSTSDRFTPGDLAGSYGGLTAQVGWGGGLGAHVLFGGTNRGVALQPISIEGFNGANLAAGIAQIELRSVS
jgi:hypothetical protein